VSVLGTVASIMLIHVVRVLLSPCSVLCCNRHR